MTSQYVAEYLADPGWMLIADEAEFAKKAHPVAALSTVAGSGMRRYGYGYSPSSNSCSIALA